MKTWTKISISIVVILIVIFMGFRMTGNAAAGPGVYDDFADCLTNNGVKMYGAYWCPHCISQKKSFGKSWDRVDYIECSLPQRKGQTQVCIQAGIKSYPTWEFSDGTRASGELSFQELSARTSCALPQN